MPRRKNLIGFIQARFGFNKQTKSIKRKRASAPLIIAGIAITAAVAFSISVESRRSGWLSKTQPSAAPSAPEVAKTSSSPANVSNPNHALAPLAPVFAPTITATKTDSLFTDVDLDTKADPGDTLKYTVVIGATGEDATGVTFSDTVDPNTAFVPGTLMTTPLARNDSFSATGNIRITAAAPGVLANDQDFDGVGPALNVTAGVFLSAQGGNVNLSADGSFTYNPAPGFEGSDSFTYTLNDGEGPSDTATVTITVSGMIWFINNNSAACLTLAAGCGRLTNPFSTLAAFEALNGAVGTNNPAANDNIFVYESATSYVGPLTLENGQKFIGQDATATLSSISGVTPPAGSDPLPATSPGAPLVTVTSAGIGITVAQNNILRGYTGGDAATDVNGSGFATLNISDVTLNGNGQTLNLSTGTLTASIASISSTNSATTGLSLTSVAGTLTTGSTTVTNSTGIGISVNTSSIGLSFANTSATLTGGTGISLITNTGAITFGSLTINPDGGQRGLLATDNTQTITATSGAITTTTGTAVEITRASSTTPLVMSLTSVSANGAPNGIRLLRTSGSFTVNGTGTTDGSGGTIQSTTNRGADINTASNITLKNMTFTNAGTTDLDATNGGLSTGDNLDTNAAIHLVSVTTATLDNVDITGGAEQGINGNGVSSFSLLNSTVTNAGNAADEDNIHFFNMSGTSAITNTTLTHTAGGGDDNLNLQTQSGTLGLTISGGSAVGTGGGVNQLGSGYLFGIRGTSNATINFSSASSTNNFSGGIVADSFDTAIMNLIVTNSTSSGNNDQLSVSAGDSSDVDLTVTGSTLSAPAVGDFLPISLTGSALDNGFVFDASITGNTITVGNGLASDGIVVNNAGGGAMNVFINGNTFDYAGSQRVILVQTGTDGAGAVNTTITGNNMDIKLDGAGNAVTGILAQSSITSPTGDGASMCADIGGAAAASNTFTHSLGGVIAGGDIRVRQRNNGTMRLPGYGGAAGDTAAVIAYLNGRNVEVSSSTATADSTGFAGGAACTQPTITGSITSEASASVSKSEGSTAEALAGRKRPSEDILWANPGEKLEGAPVIGVSQTDLQWIFRAALGKWQEAGISNEDYLKMQAMTFDIADLPDAQLASSTSSVIKIDETAAGYGWYVDLKPVDHEEFLVPVPGRELQVTEDSVAFGRVDLLTVVMRQLGTVLDKKEFEPGTSKGWLMQNSLSPAVRRLPDSRTIQLNSLIGISGKAREKSLASHVRTKTEASSAVSMNAKSNPVSKQTSGQNRRVMNHAARNSSPASMSFVDVLINIGILPAGKSITITFNVTVDNPWQGATNQVSNQGTVSGTNFGPVLTDDPDVAGAANPTLTTIDQPDVTVAVAPASVLEDGAGNLVYTFTREGSTDAALTVNFSVGGTATFNTDYTQTGAATFNATSGTVSIPIGSATATVTLDPTTDTTVELDETAILTVVSGTSYDVGVPAAATGTITNDDTDVTVAVAPSSVEEDGVPNLVYTFTRNGVTTGPLTVNFSVGGTATFNTDYTQTGAATFTATDGTVTFGAGNTTTTVTVDPTTDNTIEPNETVILTLAAGTGYNVAIPNTATGTITNDDAEVTLAVAPSAVDEDGVPNLVYTFTRTGDISGALTVNFSVGGTATFSTDYTQTGAATFTATDGTVIFGAGNTTAAVTVDPSADVTAEPDETVTLTLTAGVDYNIGTPSTATGTINNDDTTVSVAVSPLATDEDGATNLVYTFTRSDSSGVLNVNFSVGGTATFNTDYTQTGAATFTPPTGTVSFADGSLTATVTIDPSADLTVEPDETVILTVTAGAGYTVGVPASATGTINNDDTDVSVAVSPLSTTEDGAGNLVYTFTRTGVTTGALSVNFSINGTATFSTDYTQTGATTFTPPAGTVDFIAGSSTATVTVDPTADNSVEPDETVILTVAPGTGYNVGAPSAATGTITNDDSSVSVAVAPSTVDEDGVPNLVYTFTRAGSTTGALTVNFSIGGTADFSTDYTQTGAATFTPPTGTVTFGAGNSTATVTIDPSADVTTEADETVILTVTAGTGYEVGVPDSATGTINNDDNAVSVAVSPLAVDEDGATNLVYTFTRGDSNGELTVNFSINGTATFSTDYTQTGAATFTPPTGTVTFADGSLTATVTVDPSADLAVEPNETVILTVTAGAGYTVGVPASATGTITNDDTDVSVAVSPLSTTEDGAGNLVYTFTRTGVTTGALSVNFSINGTATFSTDYTQTGAASFTPPTGTVSFLAGSSTATVTVDPTPDGAAEADETVILTVTAGTGYNVGAPSAATGTITNDDTEVSVAVSPSSALEDGATNMVYTFTRIGLTSGPLTVNFSVGGTAVFAPPGGDYFATGATTFTATSGTIDFLAGSSTATITVDPLGDADLEANETVILTVTAGAGYTVGSPNSATGTILNDDNSPPTIVVGYGQCGGGTGGTMNLLVGDVETAAGSLILSATSSNTAVVPLGNISFGGSGANRTVTINAIMKNSVVFSDVTITVFDGTFTSSINIRVIVGTNKTETINIGTTTVGTDMIFGGNGDDTVNSGAGNDLICGGNGGGIVSAGLGDDTIDGGNGNDTLRGQDGNDRIIGGGGNDILEGGNDNDTLDGGTGNDTLTGGLGADFFSGGSGTDTATDFNAGQGDTRDLSIEIGWLFGVNDRGGVFAYLAPPTRWIPSDVYLSSRYHLIGPMIANKQ